MRRVFWLFIFLLIIPTAYSISVGVGPARFNITEQINTEKMIEFRIFNTGDEDQYFTLEPDSKVLTVIKQDCGFWCNGKAYLVKAHTYYNNGTLIQIILLSNTKTYVDGQINIFSNSSGGGMVGVRGSVAVLLIARFCDGDVCPTTTTTSTTAKTTAKTTIAKATTTIISSQTQGNITTTTVTVTTTIPAQKIITVGIDPAKVWIDSETPLEIKLWNDKGNVDAIFLIEPDLNCSKHMAKYEKQVVVPMGTTHDTPIITIIVFTPSKDEFECGINFIGIPKDAEQEQGTITMKHGITMRVFFQKPKEEAKPKFNPFWYFVVGTIVSIIAAFIVLVYTGWLQF